MKASTTHPTNSVSTIIAFKPTSTNVFRSGDKCERAKFSNFRARSCDVWGQTCRLRCGKLHIAARTIGAVLAKARPSQSHQNKKGKYKQMLRYDSNFHTD